MRTVNWLQFFLGFFSFLLIRPLLVDLIRAMRRRRYKRVDSSTMAAMQATERLNAMQDPTLHGLKIFIGNADQVCREYERMMNPANDDLPEIEFMACPQWQDERGDISYNGIMMVVRYYYRPEKVTADPA